MDTRTYPVAVTIVTRGDGTGNEMWTPYFLDELLTEASGLVDNIVTLSLEDYRTDASDFRYSRTQRELLDLYGPHPRPGMLSIIISRPDTEDSAGRTRPWQAVTPLIIMRARPGGGLTDTALILTHELGHTFGLAHEPIPFDEGGLTTDNWHTRPEGRLMLVEQLADLRGGHHAARP
jgi:hypothetical protein